MEFGVEGADDKFTFKAFLSLRCLLGIQGEMSCRQLEIGIWNLEEKSGSENES